uniref:Major facilitator superfamily (MFS) profile domain-containing protein n=1 Tax=Clastoptera arizonana TaxID=38151 RepID=A0A1B6EBG0_9HEMI
MGPPKTPQDTTTRSYTVACVLMSLLKLPAAWFQLSIIFFAPDINFSCISESNKNETNLNLTYDDLDWNKACYVGLNDSLKCEQWRYDTSQYTRSIVHEWDLVCDQSYGSVIAQSSFFVGILFGNIGFHLMAERIGRKGPLMLSILIQAFGSVLVGLSHTFITFLIYRLILGVGLGGTIVISGKLGNELVSKKLRVPVSLMTQIPFGLGQGVLALTAFFFRDWRDVNIAISIYSFAFVLYYWLVPESSKWLVEHEKRRKLKLVTNASQTSFDKAKNESTLIGETFTQPVAPKKVTIMSLLEGSTLRRYTISIFAMSFFAGVCFFSMNQYQAKLGSDVFFNIGIGVFRYNWRSSW